MSSSVDLKPQIQSLMGQIKHCMHADQFRLRKALQRLKADASPQQQKLEKLTQAITSSQQIRANRAQAIPSIDYPDLPVSERKEDIATAIRDHQVVIIAGETGSGKTTQIPKICLELGRGVAGYIGHTQPRRLAARSVASRIAEEMHTQLGDKVGFKIRFSDQVSDSSYIKLMTDGILLAEIQQDRFLNQYDTIIIDEAHERSLNIDFILGYLKQLLPKRPDLKLIITSATIDPQRFSKHFNDAPVIEVSGRTYPVEIRYRDEDIDAGQDPIVAITEAVDELCREGPGDILVFLSGEREIRDTQDALNRQQRPNTEVVPLYARLSAVEQNRIFQAHTGRRIVLATNVAETSLTVPGIKYVVDPGTARISRYSARSKVQRLPIEAVSQASANQRAGRCGRVSEGICIRLYSEQDYLSRPEFTDPEILRTNLASVILQMLALGLGNVDAFPFVQPPDSRSINDGFTLLQEIKAIIKQQGKNKLTKMGRQIAKLPIDPRYARMVVEAASLSCLKEVIIIAAGLSIQDPRERPQEKRQAADEKHREYADKDSDFLAYLHLWDLFRQQQQALSGNQLRKWCKQQYLNYLRMREWQDIVSQLKKAIAELGFRLSSSDADYRAIHTALAAGLLSHLGFKDKDREYLGARNCRFVIFPGSSLAKGQGKWVMAAELVETSRLFARIAAKIEPEWIEPLAEHLLKRHYNEPHWSKKRGVVQAFEKVSLYGLVLVPNRRVVYSQIDPVVSRELFIREALVNGHTKLSMPFLSHNQRLVDEVHKLEEKSRRRDLLVDEEMLVEFYQQQIPADICTEAGFKKWWQGLAKEARKQLEFSPALLLKRDPAGISQTDFPEYWYQGNLTLELQYHFEPTDKDDGVSLMLPLPLLNQVEDSGFDWLIPGLRHELIVCLIKSLPKKLRRNFVPAPNYADACLAEIRATDKKGAPVAFLHALSEKLLRMTGVRVEPEDWQLDSLPAHLTFNFKVLDGQGEVLAEGRNLTQLQHKLQGKVKQTLEQAATPELEQSGLTCWSFGELPQQFTRKSAGFEIKAYPALVAEKDTVAIQLFEQPHLADQAHQQGLSQLFKINLPSPVKYLQEKLPNKAKLGLYFNPFGQIKDLIDDCIYAAIDGLLLQYCQQHNTDIRDKAHFDACYDFVRAELNDRVLSIASRVEKGLTTAHAVQKKLKGSVSLHMINAHGDIKQHLQSLVYKGFVQQTGEGRLDDWSRFIHGLARRMEKLPIDPNKDRMHQQVIEKITLNYQQKLGKIQQGQAIPSALAEIRWMIEELRISLFAQQLGTALPISAKRIQNKLDEF